MSKIDLIREMAEDGHQPSIDWLEHQEAMARFRGIARMIRGGKLEISDKGKQKEGPGQ